MEQVWERLETEAFTAEREWCVEGIPVLTAAVSLPRPVGPQTRMLRRIRRYAEGWRRRLRRSLSPLNFYLTEEGLAFFYPMYAIAPAVEGIPVFTVPYDRLYRPPCGSE